VDHIYRKITEVVEREAACLEEFLKLLIDQQKYIVDNEIDNLKNGVARQQEIIKKIKNLEKSRIEILGRLSESENLDPKNLTISSLACHAEGEISEKLLQLQSSLLALHNKIEKAKRKNEFLIEHSMKYIEETIRLLGEKGKPRRDYIPGKDQESLILSKTV